MVTQQQVFEHLRDVLVDTFEIDEQKITLDAKLYEDLDIDSIDAVDLLVKLGPFVGEKKISPAVFKQVRTVGDVVDAIIKLMNN